VDIRALFDCAGFCPQTTHAYYRNRKQPSPARIPAPMLAVAALYTVMLLSYYYYYFI
jgi:hypothetical protein